MDTSRKSVAYPKLTINGSNIEQVDHFNFLGVIFNTNINWSSHLAYISRKLSRAIGIIN